MANVALTIDEIVARVLQEDALRNPRARDVRLVIGASAAGFGVLLLAALFRATAISLLEWFTPYGNPYLVLLSLGVAAESLGSIFVLQRRQEEAHALLAQKVAAGSGAIGGFGIGLGAIIYVVWLGLIVRYFPDTLWIPDVGLSIMMMGAALLVAALPMFAISCVRAAVDAAQ